jgi:endonuclease III
MTRASRKDIVEALLDRYPRTSAEQLGVRRADTPSGLYRILVMSLLMSARIRASIALDATAALFAKGWTSPSRMVAASWEERAQTLNQAGYARYDERTSTMLADASAMLVERYHGDLRRLREEAGRDPATERARLDEFKGVGEVGVDIFFREAQRAWPELYPFADRRTLDVAEELGLGSNARSLARLAHGDRFVRLVHALVQTHLEGTEREIVDAAAHARAGTSRHPHTRRPTESARATRRRVTPPRG